MARPRRIVTVVGARPQFVKAAVISRAIARRNGSGAPPLEELLVHTGQHYDPRLSAVFFQELTLAPPVRNLGVGSGPHGQQTGRMLELLEQAFVLLRPDLVLVYGDTNSTLAAALAAVKLHLPLAHVEAGLRSFNWRMPEEVNRVVADRLATLRFCPTGEAVCNLAAEGIRDHVHQVGDVMYDSVLFHAAQLDPGLVGQRGLTPRGYYLATIHRAENTDEPDRLAGILAAFGALPYPVVLPLHPRTRHLLQQTGLTPPPTLQLCEPLSYLEMLTLEQHARLLLTDSGGVQKEAYWLGVPCVTVRAETEWVELVRTGCNRLAGSTPAGIRDAVAAWERQDARLPPDRPRDLYGDGHSGDRIVLRLAAALDWEERGMRNEE